MRIALLILILASLLFAQAPATGVKDMPAVVTFVAPAYPRAAKDQRIMRKTLTRITVNRDGAVTEVKTIVAHPIFEDYVLEALKQWRFKPSDQEHALQVTCSFEFMDDSKGPTSTRLRRKLMSLLSCQLLFI
jgi:TonB family protein